MVPNRVTHHISVPPEMFSGEIEMDIDLKSVNEVSFPTFYKAAFQSQIKDNYINVGMITREIICYFIFNRKNDKREKWPKH